MDFGLLEADFECLEVSIGCLDVGNWGICALIGGVEVFIRVIFRILNWVAVCLRWAAARAAPT
jgi:hypothetical protein